MPAAAAASPRWPWAVLAALALLQCWTAAGMAGTPDTLRDMYFAQQIASGGPWPLTGPVIYNTLHLGPLWYYLLGASVWLVPHPLTVPVMTAAIAATKYPLAYAIGRRYGGTRLGLLFAFAFFVPGWASFILAAMTHTTVIETAVLFGAWCALRYRDRPGIPRALLLGLAASSMFHAHPTTLLIGALLVVYALQAATGWSVRLRDALLVGAVGLLSLLPMLIEQAHHDFSDLATLGNYAGRDPAVPSFARLGAMLASLVAYGAEYTARYWLELPDALRRTLVVLQGCALVGCAFLALCAPSRERRRIAVAMLLLLPLQSLFVLALRPITPYWMLFAHLPLLAVLVALGLEQALTRNRVTRAVAIALMGLWTFWSVAIHVWLSQPRDDVLVAMPEPGKPGLMDAIQRLTRAERHIVLLLALRDRYAITAPLCEPATLYAHYAEFIDQSLGVGLRARCGREDQVQIGGPPQTRTLVGLRDHAWTRIDAAPQQRIAQLGYSRAHRVLHAGLPSPTAVAGLFPAHPNLPVKPQEFVVRGEAVPGEFVIVSHRAAFYEPFEIRHAGIDGQSLDAVYRDHQTAIFRTPPDDGSARQWEITVYASADYVDVVTVVDAGTDATTR